MLEHEERQCSKHGLTKFYKSTKYHWRCQKCNSEYVTESRRAARARLIEAFGGKCMICGYNRYIGGLEFHHLEPEHKDFQLSTGNTMNWNRMLEEAKKCILVCALCHREIHAGIIHASPNGRATSC